MGSVGRGLGRGKPLERRTPLRADPAKARAFANQRSRLPAESPRRKAEKPRRREVREAVKARDDGCRGRGILPGPCGPFGWPLEVHEKVSRGRWSAGYLVESNCLALCHDHHGWVTAHPEEATRLGFLASYQPGLTPEDSET